MMNSKVENYDPQKLETNIQNYWEKKGLYRAYLNGNDGKKKYYACSMLPYPSGKLHMGHVRNYTINDVIARWKRMKGFRVLMPMGWDAFGLPAENAALNQKKSPAQWTEENISTMKKQLKSLGFAIDWSREIATCDTLYYQNQQKLFLKFYRKNLIYKKENVGSIEVKDIFEINLKKQVFKTADENFGKIFINAKEKKSFKKIKTSFPMLWVTPYDERIFGGSASSRRNFTIQLAIYPVAPVTNTVLDRSFIIVS